MKVEDYDNVDYDYFKEWDIEQYKKEIERLNKEILGLNNCIIEFHSEFCNKQAEINRLNNIINELEKDLQSNMAYYDNLYEELNEQEYIDKYFALKEVFEKLQELKGSDKE